MKSFCKILCCSVVFAHPIASHALAFLTSNRFTSTQDSLFACQTKENGELQPCESTNGASLFNPVGISYLNSDLFIANYGAPKKMGTSYITRCVFDKTHFKECLPVLGLASNYHITGVLAIGKKLLFTESFHYGKSNANDIVACDLPAAPKQLHCGPLNALRPLNKISTDDFNTAMDIASDGSAIYVSDPMGRSFFKCTYPSADNVMTCAPQASKTVPTLVDIQGNITCNGFPTSTPQDPAINCCVAGSHCASATQERFAALTSLSIDAHKQFVYLTNGTSSTGSSLSLCQLSDEKGVFENCLNLAPQGDTTTMPATFSKVLFMPYN